MKRYRIRVEDHNSYLARYKVVLPGQFEIFLNEDIEAAGCFDEDDFIIGLCKKNFKKVILETFPDSDGTSSPAEESVPTAFDWV